MSAPSKRNRDDNESGAGGGANADANADANAEDSANAETEERPSRRPPVWRIGTFWSMLADPYLDSNSEVPPSDLAQACAVLRLMLRECPRLAPWSGGGGTDGDSSSDEEFGNSDGNAETRGVRLRRPPAPSLPSLLEKCGACIAAAMQARDSVDQFEAFVDAFLADLRLLPPGAAALVPGGWSNPSGSCCVLYVAERDSPGGHYSLTVCNAFPADGLSYHPSRIDSDRPSDKLLHRTCLTVDAVPPDRFFDRSFWAVMHSLWVKPSEFRRAEVLYDVLLPWLSGKPTLSDALQTHCADLPSGELVPDDVAFSKPLERDVAADDAMNHGHGKHGNGNKNKNKNGNGTIANDALWRTPARSSSSSPWRNLLEAARYVLLRYHGSTKADLKRFTTLLKAEALGMALTDLNDTNVMDNEGDDKELRPNEDERIFLQLSCRTVAHAVLKVAEHEGWGAQEANALLTAMKDKLAHLEHAAASTANATAALSDVTEARSVNIKGGGGVVVRPDPFEASDDLRQDDSRFAGVRVGDGDVERYAGPAMEPRSSQTLDFLKVRGPRPIRTLEDVVALLARCRRACDDLNRRCRDGSSYSSRVALHLQAAQLIGAVFTEFLPPPAPNPQVLAAQRLGGAGAPGLYSSAPNVSAATAAGAVATTVTSDVADAAVDDGDDSPGRIWSRPFPSRELELTCLTLLHQLTVAYAHAWQSFDSPSRSFESERAVVALCLLSAYDCVLRHDIYGVDTASVLREDGGFCVSTSVCVANLSLYRLAGTMELRSPAMTCARERCMRYFEAVGRSCRYADLFVFRMPTDKIEVKKYGTTVLFLRKLMERCGYELVPRDNPHPPPEIESLMEWLTSPSTPLAREQSEFGMLRDMACLYKFLATMESRETELQRQRMAASEYVSWCLSFEDTSMNGTNGNSFHGSVVLDGRSLRWEVLNYRGLDLDTADVQVTVFGDRKVYFGEGGVHSPADITVLLNHRGGDRPTEDDILHADTLPTYGDTLSRQESEMLMSYLTVPYMRIPLCLAFFANGDRVTYLFSHGLQSLLRAVLFESADWVPDGYEQRIEMVPASCSSGFRSKLDEIIHGDNGNGSVSMVGASKKNVLGTSDGLLLNELRHSPEASLRPLMKMLASLNDLAEASVYSPDASLCLYLIELALDVQAFFDERGVQVSEDRQAQMVTLLTKDCRSILRRWLGEAAASDDLETMCVIHSYLAMIYYNTPPGSMTANVVSELMGSLCFVRNWHGFGLGDASALLGYGSSTDSTAPPDQRLLRFMQAHGVNTERIAKGSLSKYLGQSRPLYLRVGAKTVRVPNLVSSTDGEPKAGSDLKTKKQKGKLIACVPEQKLFAMLQRHRGPAVTFLEVLHNESSHLTSRVLSDVVTIALDTKAKWLFRDQPAANVDSSATWSSSARGTWVSPDKEMTLDLQGAQLMWRNDELKPLPDSMTAFRDFHALFGRQQMHCGLVALQQHRHWVHVVGTCYDLQLWDEPDDQEQGVGAPRAVQVASASSAGGQPAGDVWMCSMCTYVNRPSPGDGGEAAESRCQMCGSQRSGPVRPSVPNGGTARESAQPGDADDMKSKSPSAVEYRGVRFDRELDPFDKESLRKFNNEGEAWAIKLLVTGLKGHFKEKLSFKVLLPNAKIAKNDQMAVAIAGVVVQRESDNEAQEESGLPPPIRGRGNGNAFVMGHRMQQQQQQNSKLSTTWKEFVMYRERNILQVFNLVSHGRRLFRQLVYSSDSRLALHSLEPSKSVFGACGDLKAVVLHDSCLVISRRGDAGVETYIPSRLLLGTVPGALLEAYRFWHSSADDIIRGEPLDPESTMFGENTIEIMPDRTIVQRQLSRKEQNDLGQKLSAGIAGSVCVAAGQRRLVVEPTPSGTSAAAMDTDEAPKPQINETAVMDLIALGFSTSAARLALTKCNGNSAFAAEWLFNPDNAAQVASAEDREQMNNSLFRVVGHGSVEVCSAPIQDDRNTHRWRTPDTLGYGEEINVVERSGDWLRFVDLGQPDKDRWVLAFDPTKGMLLEPVASDENRRNEDSSTQAATAAAKSTAVAIESHTKGGNDDMDVDKDDDDTEMPLRKSKLLNALEYPMKGSGIFLLLSLLVDVEDLSHILLWADLSGGNLTHVELPRLKLKIVPRNKRLFLTDQAGWFICKQSASSHKLLDCHSLLLMNGESEQQFLVPNHIVTRPKLKGSPFSTKLFCERNSFSWLQTMDTRFYLYKVHTSGTFLVSQELAASIYLVHVKLLQRRYKEAFKLAPSCTVDVPLAPDEGFIWSQLSHSMDDRHPDAHACRLRLSLAIMYTNGLIRTPWEEHHELDGYLRKLPRVSASCRLTEEEERKACQLASSGTPLIKNRLSALTASSPSACTSFAGMSPRIGGSPWHKVQSRSLSFYNNHGTSLKRIHFKPEIGERGFDSYSIEVIFDELVVADEESGANRQLGFAFLYQLINSGNIPGAKSKPSVTGEILARYLHLKLSRWGRETVSTGEVEVSSSRHMAQLSALVHWQHQRNQASDQCQYMNWPSLPSDERSVILAKNGVDIYTEPGISSGIKTWLDLVDTKFQSVWPAIVAENGARFRSVPRHELKNVPNRLRFGIIQPAAVEDTGCSKRAVTNGNKLTSEAMTCPLYHLIPRYLEEELALKGVNSVPNENLPFDLYKHPAAQPEVASEILKRLEEDVEGYSLHFQKKVDFVMKSTDEPILRSLINELETIQGQDLCFVHEAISLLEEEANHINDDSDILKLKRTAMHRDTITFELLTQALLSRHAFEDLKAINSTLSQTKVEEMLEKVVEVCVRVNRISHASRAVSFAQQLLSLQREQSDDSSDKRRNFRAKQLTKDLADTLSSRRWYIERTGRVNFDPRYLVFEYVFDIILRERQVEIVQSFANDIAQGRSHVQQMIMGAGKTTVVAPLLTLLLADGVTLITQVMPSALLEQTRHIMRSRFGSVIRKRVFTLEFDRGCEDDVTIAQHIYRKLDEARRSRSVVCASPDAVKSLFLKFIEQIHSIENADIDVLTPSTSLRQNKEIVALREIMQSRSDMSDFIVPIFDLWRDGVLIMDEVDVLLHPLRSELNFPIGHKDPIDLAGFRWDLPIALLRVFFAADAREQIDEADKSSVGRVSNDERRHVLNEIQSVVEKGYSHHALQRNPHLVLLDEDFYRSELMALAAKWAAMWIIEQCSDINHGVDMVANYLSLDGIESVEPCAQTQGVREVRSLFATVNSASMKVLNLGRDWVRILLPNVLAKIDRVTFGILSLKDLSNVDQTRMPISRKLMAVPFVGKDVPSRSSEFAHPDVVIGLTVLGYRYEGLRESDVRRIVAQLKADFARQVGPRDQRPACLLFRGWLERAARNAVGEEETKRLPVLPLPLFQANDPKQLKRLHDIIRKDDRVISYYLQQHVFPACMNFQNIKISACGHELGSNMLFSRRVGFSGTPSNLLPTDLGNCLYEPGSDGRVMHVLSSPDVVSMERKADWTARSLLRDVASATPDEGGPFHCLIDTGALITGMDNEDVARYMLEHLPETFDGVVYLDHADRKMFLQRSSGKSLYLSQCGVDPARRFTFYDQVHTTGMDIKQAPDARAVVTLGKDMTFRDYAQGAFRMRGIGNGQTIRLFLIPEVEHLIQAELHQRKENVQLSLLDVPAWLLVNSMRAETVQHSMLSLQELFNCWRKEALKALVHDVKANPPLLPKPTAGHKSRAQRLRRFIDAGPDCWIKKCISLFREPVGYVIPDSLPVPRPISEKVNFLIKENSLFVNTPKAREIVLGISEQMRHTKDLTDEALGAEVVNENEQEQQQQQEEEAEEEQQKVSRFTRDDEQANPWAVTHLNEMPNCVAGDAPFYRFKDFVVRTGQPKLVFPNHLLLSDNWFRPRWIGLGDRRLKNVMVVLEWYPESFKRILTKLVPLVYQNLVAEGLQPTPAALRALSIATAPVTVDDSLRRKRFMKNVVEQSAMQDLGLGPHDCFHVAISLAEAESLRRAVHTGQGEFTSAFSLLSIEDSSCIDFTPLTSVATSSGHFAGRQEAMSCLRFVNGDMHYTAEELLVLQNAFAGSPLKDRIQFFEQCLSLRRREKYLWGDTPLAKFFTEEAEWHMLDARAKMQQFAVSLVRSLKQTGNNVDLLSLFSRLDVDGDGCLSHTELQRFFEELRLGFSPADIVKIISIIENDDMRKISWEVLVDALMIPSDLRSRQHEDQTMEEEKTVWACSNCTFRFNDPTSQECEVCGYGWDGCLHVPADKWMCDPSFGGCTFFNKKESFFCSMCDKSNPALRNVRF